MVDAVAILNQCDVSVDRYSIKMECHSLDYYTLLFNAPFPDFPSNEMGFSGFYWIDADCRFSVGLFFF